MKISSRKHLREPDSELIFFKCMDFSKAPGGQDLTKLKSQYSMFVDVLDSK